MMNPINAFHQHVFGLFFYPREKTLMKRILFFLLLSVAYSTLAIAETPTTLPWNMDALNQVPAVFPAEGFVEPGVRPFFFAGEPYQGKATRVFAWYGSPTGTSDQKYPAMVLVHGGGGTAFAEWVRLWVKRGYCAIAMDTCGCIPRGKYGDWERHPDGGPAGWGGFDQVDAPIKDQWTYHAVADIVLAHSLLRSFPEVDAERTGITGISWGGYLTCITAGVDPRFKFAVPVYGCGFLGDNSTWLDTFKGMGEASSIKWLSLWDPSVYLPRAALPMLWVTGTNDFAYPMDSLQKSYRLPSGPRTLCVRIRMPHGHGGAGENPEEILSFANAQLGGPTTLPAVIQQGRDGQAAWVLFNPDLPPASAELLFTKDTGKWQDRLWETIPVDIEAGNNKITALLPKDTAVFYFNLVTENGLVVSSEHEEIR